MTSKKNWITRIVVGLFVGLCFVQLAAAEEPAPTPAAPTEEAAGGKPLPISFSVDYTVVSDYIFRGINFSEYSGEGREGLNHQLGASISVDLDKLGTFTYSTWFEWYAKQDDPSFDDDAHGHLQEVDHAISWSYDLSNLCEKLPVTFETGWISYAFPQEKGDTYATNEWYMSLSLDDSSLFGTEGPVLNPYAAWYVDNDDVDGCWIETGISHDFAFSDLGFANTPVLKDITATPSFVLGIDKNQFDKGTHLHNMQYGLDISADINSMFGLTTDYGQFTITGFIYYSDAINTAAANDEFWGGISLGYEW